MISSRRSASDRPSSPAGATTIGADGYAPVAAGERVTVEPHQPDRRGHAVLDADDGFLGGGDLHQGGIVALAAIQA